MKKYASSFFIEIYKKHLTEINNTKPSKEIEKIVDIIFHEREFVNWLRNEIDKKFCK